MHTYYRYVIEFKPENDKQGAPRIHESCLFLSMDECQCHMNQMIVTEMLCKMDEVRSYHIESMIADPCCVPAMEVFGF